MFYVIFAALMIVIDQVIKYLVRAHIPLGESVPFLPHVMDLTYIRNTGAAFSLLEEHTWILTLLSAAIVAAVAVLVAKGVLAGRLGRFSAALIMAGGVGNLIDRLFFKYVTDMFKTTFIDFAVFNWADCCITVGAVLLFLYLLFFSGKGGGKEAGHDAEPPADGQ